MTNLVTIPRDVFNYMIPYLPPESRLRLSETSRSTKSLFKPENLYYARKEEYEKRLTQRILQDYHTANGVWDFVNLLNSKYEIFGDLEIVSELNNFPLKVVFWILTWIRTLNDELKKRCDDNNKFNEYFYIIFSGSDIYETVFNKNCFTVNPTRHSVLSSTESDRYLRDKNYKYYSIISEYYQSFIPIVRRLPLYLIDLNVRNREILYNYLDIINRQHRYMIKSSYNIFNYIDNILDFLEKIQL